MPPQDAEAARRICEALRATGIEVWFDQSELRGGDVWDHTIRQQIHELHPVHSDDLRAHRRAERGLISGWSGSWRSDRSHLMADDTPFLFPVVIDDTPDAIARVPDKFRAVQWTRLPAGEAPAEFCQRVGALLTGTAKPSRAPWPCRNRRRDFTAYRCAQVRYRRRRCAADRCHRRDRLANDDRERPAHGTEGRERPPPA